MVVLQGGRVPNVMCEMCVSREEREGGGEGHKSSLHKEGGSLLLIFLNEYLEKASNLY